MWASVRIRLLLTMAVVVLVAVGTIALVASSTVQSEFSRYVEQDAARYRSLIGLVGDYSRQETTTTQMQLARVAHTYGERILLATEEGVILADSEGAIVGQSVETITEEGAMVVFVSMERASIPAPVLPLRQDTLITAPLAFVQPSVMAQPAQWAAGPTSIAMNSGIPMYLSVRMGEDEPVDDPIQTVFINSVTRSLWMAVAVAGVAAVLLTLILSRGIVVPIEALTRAATRMEKGDLSQRVAITGRDEIGQLAHAFNAMAGGLAQLEQGRRQMVTDVAHELRTPLSNIRGYLEAVQDGVALPTPAVIASLHEEAMVLTHLVNDLQDLALAEAHQLKLVRHPTSLQPLLERVVHHTQGFDHHAAPIRVEVPPELPTVNVDPERLSQVVRNLLTNALRHTSSLGEIVVQGRDVTDGIEISVRDTGSGIAPEHVPYLFDRFYRADPARARATGGAGLGLAIVKQLVELHGGRIGVQSEVGQGTVFTVWLPCT
jgi:signal transduction histidine kinase